MTHAASQVIINFHGLGEPHAGVEAGERPYWLSFDRFEAIVDRIAPEVRAGRLAITFDDGNASDTLAAERLERRGLTATFFVLLGRIDDPRYLGAEDLRRLDRAGMTIGLHGRHHLDWRTLSGDRLADETVVARSELATILGRPVDDVAIPFGAHDPRIVAWLHDQGFARIHTSDGGRADLSGRIRPRTSIRADFTDGEIAAIVAGRPRRLHRALRAVRSRLFTRAN